MFALLGAQAHITVEEYTAPYLERLYIDGGKWEAEIVSPYFINTIATKGAVLHDCAVALYDGELLFIEEVMPLLELVTQREPKNLLLLVKDVTDEALNLLVTNHKREGLNLLVVRSKRYGAEMENDFNDLALLTGAHYFSKEMRVSLRGITAEHLGRARRVEVQDRTLFVVGGGGVASAVRDKIDEMNRQLQNLLETEESRPELMMRLARLSGSAAVLQVGALTETARATLKQQAEKGIKTLRATVEEGVLPGGGIAYINCLPALKKIKAEGDEALGVKAVMIALEAPFRKILGNAGVTTPGIVLEEIKRKGSNCVYDVHQRKVVDSASANVLDSAKVLRFALQIAASGAAIAMTTETIILKKNPEVSYEP
jgi:chaperonin GroEL